MYSLINSFDKSHRLKFKMCLFIKATPIKLQYAYIQTLLNSVWITLHSFVGMIVIIKICFVDLRQKYIWHLADN